MMGLVAVSWCMLVLCNLCRLACNVELHGDPLGLGGLVLDDDELLGDLLRLGGLVLDGDDEAVLECRRRQPSASVRHTLQSQLSQCTPSRWTCS